MPNNFMGIETLSRGIYTQQINQFVIASNLAKTYRDEYGYVKASRQRADVTSASPYYLGGPNGIHSIGTGPQLQQITRLRNLYLDFQIQLQSQTVGRNEVMMDVLSQIKGILAGDTTLEDSLSELAGAFTALAADPLNIGLRDDVVNSGKGFVDLARQQYFGLESLQLGLNDDILQTVGDINQLLVELHSINDQIASAPTFNVNDLLDARDYALTRLSRLLNVHASFDNQGVASVYLGGLTLVNATGNAQFDTNLINNHHVPLVDIRFQSIGGFFMEVTSQITGGRLSGQIEARDVAVDFFKSSLDQCVHSIIDTMNWMHNAGFGSDGLATGNDFFTGVSARDINLNAALSADPTRALLAASSRYGITTNGEMAQFMGNIQNLQADDFMRSSPRIRLLAAGNIDPTQPMNSAVTTALNGTGSNGANFNLPPLGAGSFLVNSVTVTYTNTDSLYDVIDMINAADPNVQCFFDYTDQRLYILSNNTTVLTDVTPGARAFTQLQNYLTSTLRMNNGFSPEDRRIDSTLPFDDPLNQQAFKVTPGARFSFQLNGTTYSFTDQQSLNAVLGTINIPFTLGASWLAQSQEIWLNSPNPIRINDVTGNFTTFTGLNGSHRIGLMVGALDDKALSQYDTVNQKYLQSKASLDQLNNAQAATAALAYSADESGTPFEVEQANAVKALIAFNASLQVLHLMDKMLSDLVSIVGGASSSTFTLREG